MEKQNYEIEMQNVSHCYNKTNQVLSGIDLQVKKGEIIGLLGPSGAGKTTLVNILTGQLKPTNGVVSVRGQRISSGRPDLSAIGIMMDNQGLYERLSVYENLKFYARIYHVPLSKINGLLTKTGLTTAKKQCVGNLSKGMRNRVNFCRALLKDIRILFLDEPTSGLDPSTARDLHELILEQKDAGATIFLTTHNMAEAAYLCDNVVLLHQGKIVEYGAPTEICKRYNHLNKIKVSLKNGKELELSPDKTSVKCLSELLEKEEIITIHSTEPNLETVFLELTGRRFT